MRSKEKLGTLWGVGAWKKLDSAGDVKRFLAWCIHSIRDQTLDPRTAAIMAQIGAFMLKAVEVADFEKRLQDIETTVRELEPHVSPSHTSTTH